LVIWGEAILYIILLSWNKLHCLLKYSCLIDILISKTTSTFRLWKSWVSIEVIILFVLSLFLILLLVSVLLVLLVAILSFVLVLLLVVIFFSILAFSIFLVILFVLIWCVFNPRPSNIFLLFFIFILLVL